MAFELVANRGADEIGPVRLKAVLDHQIDMAKIDVAEIDRDLFAVTWLRSELIYVLCHVQPSLYNLYGWYRDGLSESRREIRPVCL